MAVSPIDRRWGIMDCLCFQSPLPLRYTGYAFRQAHSPRLPEQMCAELGERMVLEAHQRGCARRTLSAHVRPEAAGEGGT